MASLGPGAGLCSVVLFSSLVFTRIHPGGHLCRGQKRLESVVQTSSFLSSRVRHWMAALPAACSQGDFLVFGEQSCCRAGAAEQDISRGFSNSWWGWIPWKNIVVDQPLKELMKEATQSASPEFPLWLSGNEHHWYPWGCGFDPWPGSRG